MGRSAKRSPARTCVSANEGNLLLVIAPHAVFKDADGWRLAGAVVEENGAAIEPARWAMLKVADLTYIMPTERRFEPHPDYDEAMRGSAAHAIAS